MCSLFIILLISSPATGEGIAQPAHPVPQCHCCVLRRKPTAAGTDTQAVPHQVENSGWGQSILAGRALITPSEAEEDQFDRKCQILQKLRETFNSTVTAFQTFTAVNLLTLHKMKKKRTPTIRLTLVVESSIDALLNCLANLLNRSCCI